MSTYPRGARRFVYAGVGVGVAVATIVAPHASADNSKSQVVVAPSPVPTIDLTDGDSTNDVKTITANLDANCPTPLDSAQSYALTVSAPSFVTVTPVGATSGLHCGDVATYTVAAAGVGTNTGTKTGSISFTPVVTNNGNQDPNGVQKDLVAGSDGVTVIFTTGDCVDCNNDLGGSPAAAPSIANSFLDEAIADQNTTLLSHCMSKGTNKNKSNWRGVVINYIAQDPYLMPGWVRFANFGVDPNDPTTWDTWTSAVESEVNNFCGV